MANKEMGVITARDGLANQSLGFIAKPADDGTLGLTMDRESAGHWDETAAHDVMEQCRLQLWQSQRPSEQRMARVISFKFKKGY